MENEDKPVNTEQNDNKVIGCALTLVIIGILGLIVGGFVAYFSSKGGIPVSLKKAPEVEIQSTLTGVRFNIQANDNYNFVILEVQLLNKNETIAKSFTMRADNLKKGELKQLEYKFSIDEAFESRYIRVRIKDYK